MKNIEYDIYNKIINFLSSLDFDQKMYYFKRDIGRRLGEYQKALGFTDEHMALLMKVQLETHREIKKGRKKLTMDKLFMLVQFEKPNLEYLFYGEKRTIFSPLHTIHKNDELKNLFDWLDFMIENFDSLKNVKEFRMRMKEMMDLILERLLR